MKYGKPVLIVLGLAFFVIACNKSAPETNQTRAASSPVALSTATPDQFALARSDFAKHCTACHGENAEGGLVKVDSKKLKVPSLREGHALHHTDEEFIKQITKGGDGMPAFKDKLKPEEITDLVHFVRHEFQGNRKS